MTESVYVDVGKPVHCIGIFEESVSLALQTKNGDNIFGSKAENIQDDVFWSKKDFKSLSAFMQDIKTQKLENTIGSVMVAVPNVTSRAERADIVDEGRKEGLEVSTIDETMALTTVSLFQTQGESPCNCLIFMLGKDTLSISVAEVNGDMSYVRGINGKKLGFQDFTNNLLKKVGVDQYSVVEDVEELKKELQNGAKIITSLGHGKIKRHPIHLPVFKQVNEDHINGVIALLINTIGSSGIKPWDIDKVSIYGESLENFIFQDLLVSTVFKQKRIKFENYNAADVAREAAIYQCKKVMVDVEFGSTVPISDQVDTAGELLNTLAWEWCLDTKESIIRRILEVYLYEEIKTAFDTFLQRAGRAPTLLEIYRSLVKMKMPDSQETKRTKPAEVPSACVLETDQEIRQQKQCCCCCAIL